jgi:hypothetical protein
VQTRIGTGLVGGLLDLQLAIAEKGFAFFIRVSAA